jgi:hypothetical protein
VVVIELSESESAVAAAATAGKETASIMVVNRSNGSMYPVYTQYTQ